MNKKNNLLLLGATVLFVFSVGVYFYFSYRLDGDRLEVANLYKESSDLKTQLHNLQDTESDLKDIVRYSKRISSLYIKPESVVEFIQKIENVFKVMGVSGAIDSVSDDDSPELSALNKKKLHLIISASGEWSQIVKTLALFSELPYKSTINSYSLSQGDVGLGGKNSKTSTTTPNDWWAKVDLSVWAVKNSEPELGGVDESITNSVNTDEEN